jgi:hypothetical protein
MRVDAVSANEACAVKRTVLLIKVVHTIIFWILSASVLYTLYCGLTGYITAWTWLAVILLFVESVALALFSWKCPITILAEQHGAGSGSVAHLFLPEWFADRIFAFCGTTYAIALLIIFCRVLQGWLGFAVVAILALVLRAITRWASSRAAGGSSRVELSGRRDK